MKITLLGDTALRVDSAPGMLTVEAPSAAMAYSPFHMLASGLATCTMSVLQTWATHAKLSTNDLSLEVQWRFVDDPHRVSEYGVIFTWPSLPTARFSAAKRVAELCTVHATLRHAPTIAIMASSEVAEHDHP